MQTLANKISARIIERITDRLNLHEVNNPSGGPYETLKSEAFGNVEVGALRLWHGHPRLLKVVYIGLSVEAIGLDSHMIYAFTPGDSLVPNFTLDAVYTQLPPDSGDPNFPDPGGEMYAFHLDLTPKCDLAVNLDYMRRVYEPLTDVQRDVVESPGVFPAHLNPTQRAIMSPWMLAQRSTTGAFEGKVFSAADHYLDHWFALLDDGMAGLAKDIKGETGRARDSANRNLIFHREIDEVWAKIDRMLGADMSDRMIAILRSEKVEGT